MATKAKPPAERWITFDQTSVLEVGGLAVEVRQLSKVTRILCRQFDIASECHRLDDADARSIAIELVQERIRTLYKEWECGD